MNHCDLRSPKVAATCRHPLEAEMYVNQLREEGIDAQTTSTLISGGAIEFAQIDAEVLVPAEHLTRATQIIARIREEQSNVNWDQIDVGEPNDVEPHFREEAPLAGARESLESDLLAHQRPATKSMFVGWIAVEAIALAAFLIWLFWFSPN